MEMMQAIADISVDLDVHSFGDYGVYEWHECDRPFTLESLKSVGRIVINRNDICEDHGGLSSAKEECFLCDCQAEIGLIE